MEVLKKIGKHKGQMTIIGLLFVFVTIIAFAAISPVLYDTISTYSAYGTGDRAIVDLYPLFISLAVLISIVVYIYASNRQGGQVG